MIHYRSKGTTGSKDRNRLRFAAVNTIANAGLAAIAANIEPLRNT